MRPSIIPLGANDMFSSILGSDFLVSNRQTGFCFYFFETFTNIPDFFQSFHYFFAFVFQQQDWFAPDCLLQRKHMHHQHISEWTSPSWLSRIEKRKILEISSFVFTKALLSEREPTAGDIYQLIRVAVVCK